MKKIAVYTSFMTAVYRQRIDAAAAAAGCAADYYDSAQGTAPLEARIEEYEVIFGHFPPALLKGAKKLKWLCSDFAGVEGYLDDAIWPHPGCLLSNASGAYGPTISEHIIMVAIMLLRRMPEYLTALSRREWPFYTPIRSITGSHAVMLGAGDIGSHTARRLKALGASVTGVCRSGKSGEPAFDRVLPLSGLDSVLPTADLLIMSLPATVETAGILSRRRIALLPPSAYVINVGRGSAIDQAALAEALQSRRLAGAALDVMVPEPLPADNPLWDCPNAILTPHVAGNMSLGLTCDLDVEMFCRDLAHFAAGEPLERQVDRTRGY